MAVPGDVLTDFITAPWFNRVSERLGINTGILPTLGLTQNQYCTVYNHSSVAKKIWEPVSLGAAKLDYETDGEQGPLEEIAFITKDLDSNDPHNIAILQEPLEAEIDSTARALLVGTSWMRNLDAFPSSGVKRVHIGPMDTLEYTNCGRVEAIRQFTLAAGSTITALGIGPGPQSTLIPGTPLGPVESLSEQEYLTLVMIGKLNGVKLRINGYNFEMSHDCGETWEVWATGEECSA
jgi:hypothetical protein